MIGYKVINNVESENINCQLMQTTSGEELLTCFYQTSSKIKSSSFKINIDSKSLEEIQSGEKENNGAKVIKSVLSNDKKISFVCYTNNYNKCYCLTYDITNNQWSDYNIYLNNCLL